MLDLLNLKDSQKILEVGSGSSYVLALINQISKDSKIYGLEIVQNLANSSKERLSKNTNIKITQADGNLGLKQNAPFDRILVSASAREIPQKLIRQLADNGIMVCVIRNSIFKIRKEKGQIKQEEFPGFVFVPLVWE